MKMNNKENDKNMKNKKYSKIKKKTINQKEPEN